MNIEFKRDPRRRGVYEVWLLRDNGSQRCLGSITRTRNGRWQMEIDTPAYGPRLEPFVQFTDAKARAKEYWA